MTREEAEKKRIESRMQWLSAGEDFLKKQWADARYGLKESSSRPYCVCRLINKRCRYYGSSECGHAVPGVDHPSLWLFGGEAVSLVYKPYGITSKNVLLLGEFCRDRELEIVIDTWPAWHNPGSVLFVEITTKRERERRWNAHDEKRNATAEK